MQEVWKPIEGYEGLYEVSNLGRVRGLIIWSGNQNVKRYSKKVHILKQTLGTNGYYFVNLVKGKKKVLRRTHRLVAQAFIDNPNGYRVVNHIDGVKINNQVDNLEWCTLAQNNRHAFRTGLMESLKKPVQKLDSHGNVIASYESEAEASRAEGIPIKAISACVNGSIKTTRGHVWRFAHEEG